jgi:hypothetical protein
MILLLVEGNLSRTRCTFDGSFTPESSREPRRAMTAGVDPKRTFQDQLRRLLFAQFVKSFQGFAK